MIQIEPSALPSFVSLEIFFQILGRKCFGRLGQVGVGHVLDANVLGAVPDTRAHLLRASPGRGLVKGERRGQLVIGVDLRLEIGDLLLGKGNGIGASDEAARRKKKAKFERSALHPVIKFNA